MPKVKITEGSTNAEGNDSDVLQPFAYQALYDETLETDMIVEVIGNISETTGIQITDSGSAVPAGVVGNYYVDEGVLVNGEDVHLSADGTYAIWYDGVDLLLTDTDQVGEAVPTAVYFERAASTNAVGAYTAGADGSGTVDGALYDPLA